MQRFLSPLPILWPTEIDIALASTLAGLHLSRGIEAMDAITAAVALRTGLPVVTFNVKHLGAVPGVSTVQPYVR